LASVVLVSVAATSAVAANAARVAAPSPSAVVAPAGRIGHAGRWMTDERGRVVTIHGVNMPSKNLPAYPAALNFGDDDATLLANSGINAVRLTVERSAVEPKPGAFDDAYVDHVADTVRMLASHRILSLIDFHQDEWGPAFFDNGFPEWMTSTDGAPNVWEVGFPGQYFLNPALNRAFDHFWANDIGPSGRRLQDDDADILSHVATRLAPLRGLLGYEIMNEPWPGSPYATCVVPEVGCPTFDQGAYSAYYANVIPKIRAADPNHLIWYEPVTTFNQGVPTTMHPPSDSRLGFAFHDYPLCGSVNSGAAQANFPSPPNEACAPFDAKVMENAEAHAAATGNALLQTEFGATTDSKRISQQLDAFDEHLMPWMSWSYTRYVTKLATDGSLLPATSGNVNTAMLQTLARPYPQLTSGTPSSWHFDSSTKTFTFTYSTRRADGTGAFPAGAETDIAVPAISYPSGYTTTVTGGAVSSAANAPILRVAANAADVTVVVSPPVAATSPGNYACRAARA
jgi:endoglycosylceramidase